MKSWIVVSTLVLSASAHAYYGRRSTEAKLTFDAVADVERAEQIDDQIQHLMGSFQAPSFQEGFGYPGVLGERYTYRITKREAGSAPGRKRLHYKFEGTVVFQKDAFRSSPTRQVPIKLPLAPDLVYDLGVKRGKNYCTDEHYNDEGDFWYFWDPEMKGCPLANDSENVLRLRGRLERLPNTRATYPEYDRLYGDNGNGDAVDIAIFFGYIEDIASLRRPNRRDDAVDALRYVDRELTDQGFEQVEKLDAFREYADGRRVKGINYLRRYERELRGLKLRVFVLLADTAIESRDETFHRYLIPAFRRSDVLVYDGHSGLGGNLDLAALPSIRWNREKYQILFFNGCSSYPYFNGNFFKAKGGSRNLDIVTSGLPTYSTTAGPNVMAFVQRFLDGEKRTYQKILDDLEDSNGEEGTYLTGVNGDEDNRWHP
jgi:hypothetical protein